MPKTFSVDEFVKAYKKEARKETSVQVMYLAKRFLNTDQFRVSSDEEIFRAAARAILHARNELARRLKKRPFRGLI